MSDPLSLRLLRYLPRNLISRAFGRLAAARRPRWFVRRLVRWFVARYEIDMNEAEHPIERYDSLVALFTRRLAPGMRPVAEDEAVVASPVDAKVGAFGRIENGRLYQAKGMDYSLAALLGSEEAAASFLGGSYATLYLSPRDYHRIHAPCDGKVVRSLYEPGTLWPVNPPAVRSIPSLFAVNERVTAVMETPRGPIAVVLVGATNVGRMRLAYTDFVSNQGGRRGVFDHEPPAELARGADLGVFELGSTVVLLVADAEFHWEGLVEGEAVRLGTTIGRHES